MNNPKLLSIILLSYFSNKRITSVFENVKSLLDKENIPFELIIIDDGSKDDSFQIAESLEISNSNVKAYQLSRNYTSHYAIFAGMSISSGKCVTVIPDDEQQPYELLVSCYRLWEKGEKIVIPFREDRNDLFFSKLLSISFYKVMNYLSDVSLPPKGADTFFIDREIVDILNSRIHSINTTSITEIIRLGFNPYYLPFTRARGTNKKSRWTLSKKIKLAKDYFFSSSTFPIKFITFLGVFFSLVSICLMCIYLYAKLFGNPNYWRLNEVPGWTSTITLITFFSGLILFSLGIIAEYIWRIYEEVKNRPSFIIKNKVD